MVFRRLSNTAHDSKRWRASWLRLGIIDSHYVPGTESWQGRTGVVLYWRVDDVDAVLQRAIRLGARQLEAPQDRGHGFITATIVDPFGNILGIMDNPHYLEMLAEKGSGRHTVPAGTVPSN